MYTAAGETCNPCCLPEGGEYPRPFRIMIAGVDCFSAPCIFFFAALLGVYELTATTGEIGRQSLPNGRALIRDTEAGGNAQAHARKKKKRWVSLTAYDLTGMALRLNWLGRWSKQGQSCMLERDVCTPIRSW